MSIIDYIIIKQKSKFTQGTRAFRWTNCGPKKYIVEAQKKVPPNYKIADT